MAKAAKSSPKSPILSMYQQYHWIFGDPLIVLPKHKLSESDVIRHWVFMSDCRSDLPSKKSQTEKNYVIRKVQKSIVDHWKIHGFGSEIKSELTIREKLKTLLTRIEALRFSVNPHHKFDFDWQHERFMEFEGIFDLKKTPKSTPKNQQNIQEVCATIMCCNDELSSMMS